MSCVFNLRSKVVVLEQKEKELNFHFDRVRESGQTVIQSIVSDPRLSAEEQVLLINALAEKYLALGQFLKAELDYLMLTATEEQSIQR